VVDADCAFGEVCVAGTCVAAPTGCTSNAQCAPGQVCTRGQCLWSSGTCAGQQGGGGYSGAWGGLAQCSAAGPGSVAVSSAQAWIDDSGGQLALVVADLSSSSAGVVIALSACPSAAGTVTLQAGEAMLYAEVLGAAPDTDLWIAKQASGGTLTFSSVGAVTSGSFQLGFSSGGTVTGSFTVQ
jgi:Cys-rich repeat protein